MKKNLTYAGLLTIGLLTFAGCTKDEGPAAGKPTVAYSDTQILPSASVSAGDVSIVPESKAPVAGGTDESEALKLNFARLDQTDGSNYDLAWSTTPFTADRAKAVGSTATTLSNFSTTQYYLAKGNTKITGWYPAGTYVDGMVTWALTGQEDVMTAPAQEGNKSSAMPALAFAHKLAQIQVYVYADTEEAKASWGKISSITIDEQPQTVTYTLASGAADGTVAATGSSTIAVFTPGSEGNLDVPVIKTGDSSSTPLSAGTVMIAPLTGANPLKITIVSEKVPEGKQVEIKGERAASTAYKITLKLVVKNIEPSATIGGWTAVADDADVDVQ